MRDKGWNAVVRVRLARGETYAEAVRDAVGEEAVVLRCAAEATLDALHSLMGPPTRFALVGAKRMLAFDAAVLLACVRTVSGPPRKLIGCVPIREDPVVAVARAVLHATNRIIEAIPNADGYDGPGEGSDGAEEYETEAADGLEATAFDPDDPALDDGGSAGSAPNEED